ncbi:MAG TPA: hypothetical protein PLG72_00720 [Clostridiales bacterium]|nr:hypothetical protein [Clostridiales bacterium]HOL90856.1 hypothetical protein [Clostridiales bacterium]
MYVKPDELNSSEAAKKGKSDGTTTAVQRFRPFSAAFAAVSEKRTRHTVKMTHNAGKASRRRYMVMGCRTDISSATETRIRTRRVYIIAKLPLKCY